MAKKPKPSKLELCDAEIAKWHRAQERALIMERKAAKLLKRSAIEIARLMKRRAKLEREAASAAATSPEADAPPAPAAATMPVAAEAELAMDDPKHPDLVAASEFLAGVNATRKRKRKPKTLTPLGVNEAPEPPSISTEDPDLVEKVGAALEESRMKNLGFRKTSTRRKLEAS